MAHRHDPPAVSASHALKQLRSITALLRVAASAPFKSKVTEQAIDDIQLPGELVELELPPVPQTVLDDYARWTAGTATEAGLVPPHLFPQWTFPPMIRALSALPFPMTAVLNQGCRLEVHGPLPAGQPMECTAQLVAVEREPTKIKITTKITTGTRQAGPACTALVYAVVPRRGRSGSRSGRSKESREPATVPAGAERVCVHTLSGASGRHYAFLSGDFNPIHWITPAAKAAGFRSCILHGFAQMALLQEDLVRSRCGGDPARLHVLDVRFVSPLLLPTECMAVHVDDTSSTVYVTDTVGRVTMLGTFEADVCAQRSRL